MLIVQSGLIRGSQYRKCTPSEEARIRQLDQFPPTEKKTTFVFGKMGIISSYRTNNKGEVVSDPRRTIRPFADPEERSVINKTQIEGAAKERLQKIELGTQNFLGQHILIVANNLKAERTFREPGLAMRTKLVARELMHILKTNEHHPLSIAALNKDSAAAISVIRECFSKIPQRVRA